MAKVEEKNMISFLFACIAFLALSTTESSTDEGRLRVVGGKDAEIERYPYQVEIEYMTVHRGGGSIISPHFVVTAAHVVEGISQSWINVRAGTSYKQRGGSSHRVVQVVMHEGYGSYETADGQRYTRNDIALLRVHPPFSFDNQRRPIRLFDDREDVRVGQLGSITGWGKTYAARPKIKLQVAQVPIITQELCLKTYNHLQLDGQFCALDDRGGPDACNGDSGGPFAVGGRLAGIVSYGDNWCGSPYFPGVYTAISSYRMWIRRYTGI